MWVCISASPPTRLAVPVPRTPASRNGTRHAAGPAAGVVVGDARRAHKSRVAQFPHTLRHSQTLTGCAAAAEAANAVEGAARAGGVIDVVRRCALRDGRGRSRGERGDAEHSKKVVRNFGGAGESGVQVHVHSSPALPSSPLPPGQQLHPDPARTTGGVTGGGGERLGVTTLFPIPLCAGHSRVHHHHWPPSGLTT